MASASVSAMTYRSGVELELNPLDYASSTLVERGELLEDWRLRRDRSPGQRPVWRSSFRLMVVHLLHATLLLISIFTLIVSLTHGERKVEIEVENVSQVTSTITIVVQIFFTASISLLYLLSSAVAIDAAIRHPRSIIDLDYRLQAWYGGVGPSVMNGLFHMHRFRQISRSVLFGIPLYFIAGEILKLTSSSVLGVEVYNMTATNNGSAYNHLVPFEYPNLVHWDHQPHNCSSMKDINTDFYKIQDLWQVSTRTLRPDIFVNETSHSGLMGNVLYDIPDSSQPFDQVDVNGTKMHVHCSHIKPEDSHFQPPYVGDIKSIGTDSSDGYYVQWPSNNRSIVGAFARLTNRPPYGTLNSSLFNSSALSLDLDNDITYNDSLHLLLQPWSFDDLNDEDGYKGASNQVLMVVAAPDSDLLLHDATGSVASVNVTSLLVADDCLSACSSNELIENSAECVDYFRDHTECIAESNTWHFQALGCTLRTTKAKLSLNSTGLLVGGSSSQVKPSAAHAWDDFSAVYPRDGNDFLANEFLEMFVPAPCSNDTIHPSRTGTSCPASFYISFKRTTHSRSSRTCWLTWLPAISGIYGSSATNRSLTTGPTNNASLCPRIILPCWLPLRNTIHTKHGRDCRSSHGKPWSPCYAVLRSALWRFIFLEQRPIAMPGCH
ncbi:hypothetical protein CPB85DRAFT_259683 [Mucidula mucida]|nr:hypothetical protein CPB85DRAFT_259683 [Mucidula mucida]